nr:MAG TPA: hypothetical protein [Caudoviricetes sp.]
MGCWLVRLASISSITLSVTSYLDTTVYLKSHTINSKTI